MGENFLSPRPTAAYGAALLMSGLGYALLQMAIVHRQGRQSAIAHALGHDIKGKISLVFYGTAVALAFVDTWLSMALYTLVAAIWLIPDRRIERALRDG
jgi:uncharacterized membrane protein